MDITDTPGTGVASFQAQDPPRMDRRKETHHDQARRKLARDDAGQPRAQADLGGCSDSRTPRTRTLHRRGEQLAESAPRDPPRQAAVALKLLSAERGWFYWALPARRRSARA